MIDKPMNEIDELMRKPVLELTAQDIDSIVAYHRRQRARKIAGEKPTKPKVDLSTLISVPRPAKAPIVTDKRRF